MPNELVIHAPKGFEFVDDGGGEVLYRRPVPGEWILAYGPEGGKMRAYKVGEERCYTTLGAFFPILKKNQEVVKGDVRHIPPPLKCWYVQDIYGRDVTIPEGWSYVAFRPWEPGEWFLDKFDRIPASSGVADDRPRIIVKKKEN